MIFETNRLILRKLTPEDSPFILRLVNEPSWLQFIGDRGVKNLEDAKNYILTGPMAMYERFGFGLFLTELKPDGISMGICGLLKRDTLDDVDIGFAFLPEYWGQGYALEAAEATMAFGRRQGIKRIIAITSPENVSSMKLLRKLGMTEEKRMAMPGETKITVIFS